VLLNYHHERVCIVCRGGGGHDGNYTHAHYVPPAHYLCFIDIS